MNNLGDLLKKLRGNRTLREIAKLTGISHTFIMYCEKGFHPDNITRFTPSPDILFKLSQVYNYSYVELMIMAGHIPNTISQSVDLLEKENILKVGDVVLSEAQKKKLLQMIRVMFADEENQ